MKRQTDRYSRFLVSPSFSSSSSPSVNYSWDLFDSSGLFQDSVFLVICEIHCFCVCVCVSQMEVDEDLVLCSPLRPVVLVPRHNHISQHTHQALSMYVILILLFCSSKASFDGCYLLDYLQANFKMQPSRGEKQTAIATPIHGGLSQAQVAHRFPLKSLPASATTTELVNCFNFFNNHNINHNSSRPSTFGRSAINASSSNAGEFNQLLLFML